MAKDYTQHIIHKKQRVPFTPENGLCCHCQIVYKRPELGSPWQGPTCNEHLSFKVEIGDSLMECCLYTPYYLSVGDLVTLDCAYVYPVQMVLKRNDSHVISLKGYKNITIHSMNEVTKVLGFWWR